MTYQWRQDGNDVIISRSRSISRKKGNIVSVSYRFEKPVSAHPYDSAFSNSEWNDFFPSPRERDIGSCVTSHGYLKICTSNSESWPRVTQLFQDSEKKWFLPSSQERDMRDKSRISKNRKISNCTVVYCTVDKERRQKTYLAFSQAGAKVCQKSSWKAYRNNRNKLDRARKSYL